MDYEAIIVGAGPAGIFSALTLAEQGIRPVLLLELGKGFCFVARQQRITTDAGKHYYIDLVFYNYLLRNASYLFALREMRRW